MDYMNKDMVCGGAAAKTGVSAGEAAAGTGRLQVIVGDVTIGMRGEGFSYLFSGTRIGMESLVQAGKEWLYRAPVPTFWRALTDNDRGSGFGTKSGMWLAADCFIRNAGFAVSIDDRPVTVPMPPANNAYGGAVEAKKAAVTYTYETITTPQTTVTVTYEVYAGGGIHVSVRYAGRKGLPQLPVFGMRFVMPTCADRYRYEGLSGETYPDRMAGGIPGVYEVEGLPVTPYMVPQDCGMHMQTKWVEVYRSAVLDNSCREKRETGLCFRAEEGKRIAFACLPYTALELENATHHEELPPARRTVLTVLGAVRGVGGIDSWGTDVEPAYHISGEEDIAYGFWIDGPPAQL